MLTNIEQLLQGARDYCEDELFVGENFAFVMDGATGITGEHITDEKTDAVWFVKQWKQYLMQALKQDDILLDIVKRGVKKIAKDFLSFDGANSVIDKPSATLSIVRDKDGYIEYYSICDSVILIRKNNDECLYLMDDRLVKLDNINFERMKIIAKEKNKNISETFKDIFPYILENRKNMNKTNGYAAISDKIDFLESGLIGKIKKSEVKDILIFSDGFAEVYDLFSLYATPLDIITDIAKNGVEVAYNKLRIQEEKDASCQQYVRNKKSDDVSIIYAKII